MNAKKKSLKDSFKNSILKNILLIIVSGLVLLMAVLVLLHTYTRQNKSVIVPQLKGLQLKEAEALLKSKNLNFSVVDSLYNRNAIPGAIIEQVPVENSSTKEGREVYLTIYANNPPEIAVPWLVDYSVRQAEALLSSMGFEQLTIEEVPSDYKGLVKSVQYRGRELSPEEKIPAGSPLTIIVGNGLQPDSIETENEQTTPSTEGNLSETREKSNTNSQTTPIVDESFF